ncbi:MAG: hypothetical protein PHI12_10015 [Dehalococcoidales bacterium]|nr:hypothetical protein [Dehalococcoidales bacterium]
MLRHTQQRLIQRHFICYVEVIQYLAEFRFECLSCGVVHRHRKLNSYFQRDGKFCESGDILIRDIRLPQVSAGDIIAVAGCGAYSLPKAANYNASLRPAVVMVKEGKARLIRRRETIEDLTRYDII